MADERFVIRGSQIRFTRSATSDRRWILIGAVTVVCVTLFVVFVHNSAFDCKNGQNYCPEEAEDERLEKRNFVIDNVADDEVELAKRDWLTDLFGGGEEDASSTTTTTTQSTTTTTTTTPQSSPSGPTTEDAWDKFIDELFEGDNDNETESSTSTSPFPFSTSPSTSSPSSPSTSSSTSSTSNSSTSTSSTSSTTTITTTTTTTTTTTSAPNLPGITTPTLAIATTGPRTKQPTTTTTGTTTPFCARRGLLLANMCVIPDQLKQQRNFNITYQDFVDAVTSDFITTFWEGCMHDDPCTPDVDVTDASSAIAARWINGNNKAQLCPWIECLEFINGNKEFCMKEKEYILNITRLMCSIDFTITKGNQECAEDMVRMVARDMADLREDDKNTTMERCHENFLPCQTDCKKYYEDMAAIFEISCTDYASDLATFCPWHWYRVNTGEIQASCGIETEAGYGFHYYGQILKDNGMVAGIVLSCVVSTIAIFILTTILAKRLRRGKRYDRQGIEYSEVTGLMADEDKHHY